MKPLKNKIKIKKENKQKQKMSSKINKSFFGFSLIEALVLLFVFSVITLAFYNVMSLGTRYILMSKNRLGAIAVANEKMEIVRNMRYEDVGIVGGACAGNIPQDEDVTENGKNYHVHTLASFMDDSFDGTLGGAPNDTRYQDYKLIKIIVSWNNGGTDQGEVMVMSRFVPQGLEGATSGDGVLSINVFSNPGAVAVPQATVHIVNSDVGLDETRQTDDSGNVMLVGAKESINEYQLTISKSGYETVSTFAPYPNSTFNPVNTHSSVIAGTLNISNLEQNKTADLKIATVDYINQKVSDINFTLIGGKILGNEANPPINSPVYSLNADDETNSDGEKIYNSISPGQYSFALSTSEDEYSLIGIDVVSPFSLLPEEDRTISARVARKDTIGFLVEVAKSLDSAPLEGASVKLKNEILSYDQEIIVGNDGMAFFPKDEVNPVIPETYQWTVSATGYEDQSGLVIITEGLLKSEKVQMVLTP